MGLLCVAGTLAAGDTEMYRYHNAQGVLVVDFSIPPEYVSYGYDVITSSGQLIRTVPAIDDTVTREAIERRKRQDKEDRFILRSYSTLDQVEFARNRRLELVEREIGILNNNLKDFVARREELRNKAAAYQASGQENPQNIMKILSDLDAHETLTKKLLAERYLDLNDIRARYDRYAERLVALRPSTARDSASSQTDSEQ